MSVRRSWLIQVMRNGRRLTRRVRGSAALAEQVRAELAEAAGRPPRRPVERLSVRPTHRELELLERRAKRGLLQGGTTDTEAGLDAFRALEAVPDLIAELRRAQSVLKWCLQFIPGWVREFAPGSKR